MTTCPHANANSCAIAARLAGLPAVSNRTDDSCDHCQRCDQPQDENAVTASLAVASVHGSRQIVLARDLAHLLAPHRHPAPLVQIQPVPTSDKRLHIGFHHGMGDEVHVATLLQLYRRRGWDVTVCAPNGRTAWLWEACGIRRECPAPVQAAWGYPDANSFWDNGSAEGRGGHKVIDHVGVSPFPTLNEPKESLWRELCGLRIDLRPKLSQAARDEATAFLAGLSRPIVAYHGTGNSMRDGKSIPADVTLGVMRELVQQDVSVVLLDWSAQDPIVSHQRCKGVKAGWGDIDLERMLALYAQCDLVVGIDSGPFHVAPLVAAKRLGIFPPDHVILPWRCVIPAPNDLHLIKRTLHWRPDHAEHRHGDLVPHAERRVSTYPCVFYDPPLTAALIVDAILQQLQTVDAKLAGRYTYQRVGYDQRELELLPSGRIGDGALALEKRWSTPRPGEIAIHGASGMICHLVRVGEHWTGRWEKHERMPIRLTPVPTVVPPNATACCHRGAKVGRITCATLGRPDVFACPKWEVGLCVLRPTDVFNDAAVTWLDGRTDHGRYAPQTTEKGDRGLPIEPIKRLPACSLCEKPKQRFHVCLSGQLGNCLRTIASAKIICDEIKAEWDIDFSQSLAPADVNAVIESLFPGRTVRHPAGSYPLVNEKEVMTFTDVYGTNSHPIVEAIYIPCRQAEFGIRHIYALRPAGISDADYAQKKIDFYRGIVWPAQLLSDVEKFTSKMTDGNLGDFVGCHVRYTDNLADEAKRTRGLNTQPDTFIDKLRQLGNQPILLCTDSPAVRAEIEAALPDVRIIRPDKCTDPRWQPLYEMHLLSRTRRLIGSQSSTFSYEACFIRGIDLEVFRDERWLTYSIKRQVPFASQFGEDRWIAEHVKLPIVGTVVEVGCGKPIDGSNSYYWERAGWRTVLIEADQRNIEALQAERDATVIHAAAVAPGQPDTVTFHQHADRTLSGLLSEGEPVTVRAATLDALLTEAGIERVDVLSVDTEGTELDVLAGFSWDRWRPAVVIVEYQTLSLPSNADPIKAYFAGLPYRLVHVTAANLIFTREVPA